MAPSTEERFKNAMLKMYGNDKKYFLLKDEYYKVIEQMKTQTEGSKDMRSYYLLSR